MTKTENAVLWMINLADDNSHGYSWGGWGPQDYDCGHAIITAFEQAGIPVKSKGATYTGNMYPAMMACGFTDVTKQCNLDTGAGMQRGDVLLNEADHTAMYIGGGRVVHARSAEGNIQPGDQSGNEIRAQSYWNYPWNYVLRPPTDSSEDDAEVDEEVTRWREFKLMKGDYPLLTTKLEDIYTEATASLQCLLQLRQIGDVTINGFYDKETYNAVLFTQKLYGLLEDGEAGADTFYALLTDGDYYPERT